VTFKFYPGGVMGNDKAVLRKIRIGQLHGGAVVGGTLSAFFPANQIYAQPMKFKTIQEVDFVRSQIDPIIIEGLEQAGFITFGLIGGGVAYIMSKEPVETITDLRNQKVWIPDNDKISQDSIKAFGISPIPLPVADVRTSLQSGLINTVATSPVGAIVLQWHTQIKYITDIPLIYLHAVLTIEKKAFHKISDADQKTVTRIMTAAMKEIDVQNRQDNAQAIQALKNQGITFLKPSEPDMAEWYRVAEKASTEMIHASILPEELVNKLDILLKEFHMQSRAGHDQ